MKRTPQDWAVDIVAYSLAVLMILVTAVPLMNVLSKAFSSETALVANQITAYPIGFQLATMKYVLQSDLFLRSFGNSIFVTLLGSALNLAVTLLAAYPLSKRTLLFQKPLLILFVFTMWFNGGMIPTYLVIKQFKMVNSFLALILPGAIGVYNLLIVKNYFESLPDALEESARVDGAGIFTTFFRVVLPLSKPVIATILLFVAVSFWNDYFSPMIYITRTNLKTLPVYLRDMIVESQTDVTRSALDDQNLIPEGIRSATIVASTLPILIVYPFLQKHFVKGVLIGAVKG
ncbi:MAG: carbohydrate ABC transporter permease [Provencibacterium sp.]|nr:carbohydrate ABC transporter permease [Provencibacterium sp.]